MRIENEMIVAAAVQQGDMVCFVSRPGRHHNVLRAMAGAGIGIPIVGKQGFVTSTGRFVDRREAMGIAEDAGQLIANHGPPDELFSEDVW